MEPAKSPGRAERWAQLREDLTHSADISLDAILNQLPVNKSGNQNLRVSSPFATDKSC